MIGLRVQLAEFVKSKCDDILHHRINYERHVNALAELSRMIWSAKRMPIITSEGNPIHQYAITQVDDLHPSDMSLRRFEMAMDDLHPGQWRATVRNQTIVVSLQGDAAQS